MYIVNRKVRYYQLSVPISIRGIEFTLS